MGSVFHLPVLELTHKEFIAWSHASNYKILATTLEGAQSVYDCDLKGKKAIVIGSEAVGVTKEILLEAQEKIFIPMEGNSESLNAAVASGIILFESLRQRLAGK